tara:strand:+ start:1071 stop:1808 length:738 start_codon:yes stop_codon:yes gene_type:complete
MSFLILSFIFASTNVDINLYQSALERTATGGYDQALPIIEKILKNNPDHAKAKKLQAFINRIDKLTDEKEKEKQRILFLVELATENLQTINNENKNLLTEVKKMERSAEVSKAVRTFEKKYLANKFKPFAYKPSKADYEIVEKADEIKKQDATKAQKYLYDQLLAKNWNPYLTGYYLAMLTEAEKYEYALETVEYAIQIHPKQLSLRIYRDHLEKLKQVRTKKEASNLRLSLANDLILMTNYLQN